MGTVVAAAVATIVAGVLTDWFSLAEPHLVYVGPKPPNPPVLRHESQGPYLVFHAAIRPRFRNTGIKAGHIAHVEIRPEGLTPHPEKVELIYLDRTPIGWREEKHVRCEYLVRIDPSKPPGKGGDLSFRAYFYDPLGREVYWEGLVFNRTR
jgi:hypothetical protein